MGTESELVAVKRNLKDRDTDFNKKVEETNLITV
jgi:hypothetical protein